MSAPPTRDLAAQVAALRDDYPVRTQLGYGEIVVREMPAPQGWDRETMSVKFSIDRFGDLTVLLASDQNARNARSDADNGETPTKWIEYPSDNLGDPAEGETLKTMLEELRRILERTGPRTEANHDHKQRPRAVRARTRSRDRVVNK